jgi:hypothetical protein
MLRLSTEFYAKRARLQCINVIAIRKIASKVDGSLEQDVPSASICMDATDRHEELRGTSAGTVQILIRYRLCFSVTVVPEMKILHLHWLVPV